MGDAFIPGNFEDIVRKTGNKRVDLQEYLNKVLRKERFYLVKTDYLAKEPSFKSSSGIKPKKNKGKGSSSKKIKQSFNDFTAHQGTVIINITINKVYVFHKSLKEIEEFFTKI